MDPPYYETEGYGADFGLDQYQAMADFMRRCEGWVMVSINDRPVIREVFAGFRFEHLATNYTTNYRRTSRPEQASELAILNW